MVKILNHILWFLIALFALCVFVILAPGCSVIKAKKTITSDSARVNTLDSGSLKKNTVNEKTTADWQRQTLIFSPGFPPSPFGEGPGVRLITHDTTINQDHYVYSGTAPIDYNRLAAIINERGNFTNEKQGATVDSSWKKAVDSLRVIVKQSTKNKTEKALTFWQIIGIAVGVSLVFFLLGKFKLPSNKTTPPS